MPIAGTSRIAALPLNFGSISSFHCVTSMADEIGAVADRVGVVDLRQERHPVGHAFVQIGIGRLGDVHRLVGRDALARNLVAVELAFGEDRQDVVEFLDLLHLDALQHAALGGELRLPAFDVGDVDRVRLGDEAIDRGRGVEILHRHLEAEILGRLVADRLHDRVRHADVAQLDVLDFLRPDRRKPGDRAGTRGATQQRAAGLEQRPPREASLRRGTMSRSMIFRHGVFRRLGQMVAIFAHDGSPCAQCS